MPADFQLGPQGRAAIRRLADAPREMNLGAKQGLADHALKLKREFQTLRRGAAKGLRYDDPVPDGDGWQVKFGLRYIAAWHEKGTRPHRIVPRGLGRARLHKTTGAQVVRSLTKRQAAQGGKKALLTPQGPRSLARVRGIPAGRHFERLAARRSAQGDVSISDGVMRRMSGGR